MDFKSVHVVYRGVAYGVKEGVLAGATASSGMWEISRGRRLLHGAVFKIED